MAVITGSNQGIVYNWASGQSGWGTSINATLLKLDTISQLSVRKYAANPAETTAVGYRYLVNNSATGSWAPYSGSIALVTGISPDTYSFYTAAKGWQIYNEAEKTLYIPSQSVGTIVTQSYFKFSAYNYSATGYTASQSPDGTKTVVFDFSAVTSASTPKVVTWPAGHISPMNRTGDTMTGVLNMDNFAVTSPIQSMESVKFQSVTASIAAGTINVGTENTIDLLLDQHTTASLTNWPASTPGVTTRGTIVNIIVHQPVASFNSVSFAGVKWPFGTVVYTGSDYANVIDMIQIESYNDGTTMLGSVRGLKYI